MNLILSTNKQKIKKLVITGQLIATHAVASGSHARVQPLTLNLVL